MTGLQLQSNVGMLTFLLLHLYLNLFPPAKPLFCLRSFLCFLVSWQFFRNEKKTYVKRFMKYMRKWMWSVKSQGKQTTCLWCNQPDPVPSWCCSFRLIKIEERDSTVIQPCIVYGLPPANTSYCIDLITKEEIVKHHIWETSKDTRAPQQALQNLLACVLFYNSYKLSATSLLLLTRTCHLHPGDCSFPSTRVQSNSLVRSLSLHYRIRWE